MARVELRECDDIELLVRTLYDALPDDCWLRRLIGKEGATAYTAWIGKKMVGAALVRWHETTEIELLAIMPSFRQKGIGRILLGLLIAEGGRRSVNTILVGTGNFAVGNIIFYQKCGFRMSFIRRDFFPKTKPSKMERGIVLRDMIVFDYQINTP
jgi:GNAT superfamily N-acetyltransferase